jgi:protein-tyrosine phosphatase
LVDRTPGGGSSVVVAVKLEPPPVPTPVDNAVATEPGPSELPVTELLILCTGNAARSVMAGFMLDHLKMGRSEETLHIVTAGTLTIDGQPMGQRTRAALSGIPELANTAFGRHRSRQVHPADLERADLVVVMEADHVRFVRRQFPDSAGRTATIRRLCEDLAPPPPGLPQRVAALNLAEAPLFDEDDVIDPAGGDELQYAACAAELWSLCRKLITLL